MTLEGHLEDLRQAKERAYDEWRHLVATYDEYLHWLTQERAKRGKEE